MDLIDKQYQNLIHTIVHHGNHVDDRTGVGCRAIHGYMLKHDMSKGFPALTCRKIPYKSVRVELEGFIKGINSKKWYQERGCKFWDEWCNPRKVPYSNDPETKAKMLNEDDLGIIYGTNWRSFQDPEAIWTEDLIGIETVPNESVPPVYQHFVGQKYDQLETIVDELKSNPNSRRMYVTAWNPLALKHAALPSCHDSWTVSVMGGKLNLSWRQRSVDVILGLPNNIAFYATLLHLLALEGGYEEGHLVGYLDHSHIYENAGSAAIQYMIRDSFDLPKIETVGFKNIFDWDHRQTKLVGYKAHERIKVDVAV